MAFSDDLADALAAAPDLYSSPALAVTAAQSGDPTGTAQALGQASNMQAAQTAADGVTKAAGHPSVIHRALGWLGHGASEALHVANAPLQEVQHTYRYLHQVLTNKGVADFVGELVPTVIGGVAGAALGGPAGAALGAELGGDITGRLAHPDLWQSSQHATISPGRDIASSLGLKQGSKPYSVVAGIHDALFDIAFDPLAIVGKFGAAGRAGEDTGIVGAKLFGPGLRALTPEDVDAARDVATSPLIAPKVNRAFSDIAKMDAGEVVANYPKLAPLAAPLGKAGTADEVADVFKTNLRAAAFSQTGGRLPSMGFTRSLAMPALRGALDYEGPGSRIISAADAKMPQVLNPQTLQLSSRQFSWSDPGTAVRGVYEMVRFGESRQVAQQVATDFLNAADDAARRDIFKNAVVNMLRAKGFADDSPFIARELSELGLDSTVTGGHYGADVAGRDLSRVALDGGATGSAGILLSQAGNGAFPDFHQITREARSLNAVKNLYGAADDFFWKHWTQGVFKKLVLLSAGTAERIAGAEILTNVFRQGGIDELKSKAAFTLAKLASKQELEDPNFIDGILGGVARMVHAQDLVDWSPRAQLAAQQLALHGGVPGALEAGHMMSAEVGGKAEAFHRNLYIRTAGVPERYRLSNTFGLIGPSEAFHTDAWQRWLSTVSNDGPSQVAAQALQAAYRDGKSVAEATADAVPEVQRYLESQGDRLSIMQRTRVGGAPEVDPLQDWARVIVENVKGATHAPLVVDSTGRVLAEPFAHPNLLQMVADGQAPSVVVKRDLTRLFPELDKVPVAERPLRVPGRTYLPVSPAKGWIEAVSNAGFRRMVDPIINGMAREPLYLAQLEKEYRPLVDAGWAPDEALMHANIRASTNLLPFVHNTYERSQFAELSRNFMPFYFAQEQAYKRMFRLLADDPGAFRRYQMALTGFANVGHITQDGQGNQWLMYPGAGMLTKGALAAMGQMGLTPGNTVPVGFSANLKSLNTVFPFTEDPVPWHKPGPMVTVALHAIKGLFPELNPAATAIAGEQSMSGSVYNQLIPNATLRRLVTAAVPQLNERAYANGTMWAIQYLDMKQQEAMAKWVADGHNPDDTGHPNFVPLQTDSPADWQAFVSKVKNITRAATAVQAAVGLLTPTSPVMQIGDVALNDELRQDITKFGPAKGFQTFLDKHPNATALTVSHSKTPQGSATPASATAQDFINAHPELVHGHFNRAGAWLVPQLGKFDSAVYNEQLATQFRTLKAPIDFLKELYIKEGDAAYYDQWKPAYDQLLAQTTNPTQRRSLQSAFSKFVTNVIGPQNPVWWDDAKSAEKDHNRQLVVTQLGQLFGDIPSDVPVPGLPDTQQVRDVRSVYDLWKTYKAMQSQAQQNQAGQAYETSLRDGWDKVMTQIATESPNLKPVIDRIFRYA